ncbi:MAG: tetratricopeptide repeat protein [Cyanobacteria bacterium]|nr:tetratricopeptide repeat protein [Cyanobacteriota bacterium]MDW8199975.1 tetratricopeptide repeat protein [Cyanobacteriota bacterium SKYGB_h_bin112]
MLETTIGGRYYITKHLGGGGFAQTYLAIDQHLPGKPCCVVKQLKPKLTDPVSLQAARRLFDTEATVLYTLGTHDQIPRLFAHFEENEEFYLVQEFIEGDVLTRELIAQDYSTEDRLIAFMEDVLSTLDFVHQQQVVHRDIKPSNLIRRHADGKIVLIDFGAVKQISAQSLDNLSQMTFTIAVGSAGYTPNEQMAGNPRYSSDIYALGIICIQALTKVSVKRLPVDPRTSELIWRDRAKDISSDLANILDKMVRCDFRERYQSAAEVLQDLQDLHTVLTAPGPRLPMQFPVATPNDGYLGWFERADELLQFYRYHEAASAYMKVVQAKPDEVFAWFKLGIALENSERYDDAAESYGQVLQLQPDDYFAWLKHGKMLEILGLYEEALASYDCAVEYCPENYWAWRDRGKVLEALERYDDAVNSYNRAVYLKPEFELAVNDRKRVLSLLKRDDTLYHLQHYDEVIASCDKTLQDNPNDPLAWFMRGMALENLQRLEEAITSYDHVVAIQADDHLAWFKRGTVLEKLGQYEAAIASYDQVVHIRPDHYWAWYDQGRIFELIGRYDDALDAYDRAFQINANFQPAVEARKRSLRRLRGDTSSYAAESSDSLNIALVRRPIDSAAMAPVPVTGFSEQMQDSWLMRGLALEQAKRYSEALAIYDRQIQTQPGHPEAWSRRASVLFHLGSYEEAVQAYAKAIQLNPYNAELWYRLGGLTARLKRYKQAVACFNKAIHLQPDRPDFWYWQGRAAQELGNYQQAIAAYDKALSLKPDYTQAASSRETLLHLISAEDDLAAETNFISRSFLHRD